MTQRGFFVVVSPGRVAESARCIYAIFGTQRKGTPMTQQADAAAAENLAAEKIKSLRERAKSAGISLMAVCRSAGHSYSTAMRWEKRPPKSLVNLAAMEIALDRMVQAQENKSGPDSGA